MAQPNGLNPTFYSVNTTNGYTVNGVTVIDSTGAIIAPISLNLGDDDILTAGTTTTTAATKITLEFDKTTTGIGQFKMGDMSNPQVLITNPGATVSADTVNILHSAGAGNCDDLLGRYTKVAISGNGDSGITMVADAPRAYVLGGTTVASQVYASQPWAKHTGTGAITAMSALSAKLDVDTDAFTASTVNAGHFHITGAATVTSSMFDGVMIEVYPDVTCLDAGLRIVTDTGAVMTNGISISGVNTNGVNIAGSTQLGVNVALTALTAGDAYSGVRSTVTSAAANNSYGVAGYFESNLTGTVGGTFVYGTGSWINGAASLVSSGRYIAAQDNGVYIDTSATLTGSKIIFGLRMESFIGAVGSGITHGESIYPFSLNTANNGITALFECMTASDLGTVTAAGSDAGTLVPLFKDAGGNVRYVKLYTN